MKSFRKNVAIAIDGGGIRGIIPARALAILEKETSKTTHEMFRLAAGTSTGSIISAGIGVGLTADQMHELYLALGKSIFKKSWRTFFWPLSRYRYPGGPLESALKEFIGTGKMSDFWNASPPTDVVITAFDVVENKTCFIKPYKLVYENWPITKAVLASSCVPTYFPVVDGRYVDGGVGAYANPCYLAAYEALFCLEWKPEETTLFSLGTGRDPHHINPGDADRFATWDWLNPLLGAFLASADDQQVHLVETFFEKIDFRRFQVDFPKAMPMDDANVMDELTTYGEQMGQMILDDQFDQALGVQAERPAKG